ncbi:hypothetical protein SynBIOSE41_01103 [Synechococcus sp. BIOS-E4-1]|uniref:hypothetical protein n=1 Tax=Synechococcus sp. BIOS-E4-1 TaxID=1400864 RepID=UPI00164669E5|nr:hypothetical protein [Synechococcus sp. BIOS-E4-1]QNI53624.1 hypothetical protein SynBIOSE41_01103 [Synechococcus sp. BIOS-E4-1]
MLEELQAKPQRPQVEEQVKQAEQRSFDRAYKQTRKEIAAAEGAAAGAAAASSGQPPAGAVERARARALGQEEAPAEPAVLGTPAAAAPAAPSGRFIQGADGQRYPEEFFDLTPADQRRFKELMAEKEQGISDQNTIATIANGLLDQHEVLMKRVLLLEKGAAEKDSLIVGLTRLVEQQNNAIEVAKSQALLEQEAGISQQVMNLSAIRAEAGQEAEQHQREREQAAAQHREQLEAQATAIDALSGSVTSTTFSMEERGNAVEAQLVAGETRQQKLDVAIQELEGKTDAWTDPITRAEVNTMATDAVAEQWRAQLPALVDAVAEELMIQFPDGVHGQRRDSEYVRSQKRDAARLADQQQGIS